MGIQRQDGLHGHMHALESIILKHDLAHPLPVRLWVHRWLRQEDLPPAGIDLELFVEGVIPEMLHVFPVLDDTVFHRLGELQIVPVLLCLIADHDVLDFGRAEAFLRTQNRSTNHRWKYFGTNDVSSPRSRCCEPAGGWLTMFRKIGACVAYFDKLERIQRVK